MDIFRIAHLLVSQLHMHLEFSQIFRLSSINAIAAYCEHCSPIKETLAGSFESVKKHETDHQSISFNPDYKVFAGVLEPIEGNGAVHPSAKLLLDPKEREQFKNRQLGLRRGGNKTSEVELIVPELEDAVLRKYTKRRSSRTFMEQPLPFKQFSEFLGCLRQISLDGKPKYQWGSAGGLYPVQIYAYIKPERIQEIDTGIYYYHPVHHRLSLITPDVQLEQDVFGFINQHLFNQAAFALFLIGQLKAIEPMYAELSRDFCLIEAGEMVQVLEMSAPSYQIALCQTGGIGFKKIERMFALEEGCIYLHSLLGGAMDVGLQERQSSSIVEGEDWEEGTL